MQPWHSQIQQAQLVESVAQIIVIYTFVFSWLNHRYAHSGFTKNDDKYLKFDSDRVEEKLNLFFNNGAPWTATLSAC